MRGPRSDGADAAPPPKPIGPFTSVCLGEPLVPTRKRADFAICRGPYGLLVVETPSRNLPATAVPAEFWIVATTVTSFVKVWP